MTANLSWPRVTGCRAAAACALVTFFGGLAVGPAWAGAPGESTVESAPVEPVEPSDAGPINVVTDPDERNPAPDPGEADPSALPPDGKADRPTMPWLERDMIAPRSRGAGRGTASLMFSKVGEDLFMDISVSTKLRFGKWHIAPRLPLRIRLDDAPPKGGGIIRAEDWDEISDFARILQFVQYGDASDPIVARFGELHGVTLGHGSIVNRYYNTIDIDHYQGGLYTHLDFGFLGGEAFVNDVLGPEVFAGRLFARPFSPLKKWPYFLRNMKFGVTGGIDINAPLAVNTDSGGKIFAHPDHNPKVLADGDVGLFGIDIEVPIVSTAHVDVVPYADLATVDANGIGVHVGSYVNVRFNPKVFLRTRLEYRFSGEGYEPGYISPFYEVERYSFRGGEPKLKWLKSPGATPAHSGLYFEADLRIARMLRYTLIYATHGGERGHDLLMRLRLPNLGPLRTTFFFARVGFDGFDNLFAANQTVWGVAARLKFAKYFFVSARVKSEWWLDHTKRDGFSTTTDFNVGGGVIIRL